MFQGQYLDPHAVHEMHQHAIPLVNPAFGYHGHDLASQITPGMYPPYPHVMVADKGLHSELPESSSAETLVPLPKSSAEVDVLINGWNHDSIEQAAEAAATLDKTSTDKQKTSDSEKNDMQSSSKQTIINGEMTKKDQGKSRRSSVDSAQTKRRTEGLSAEEKRRIILEKNRQAASRCRKKRKTLLQDLEKHAKEVSDLNQTLTVQVQTLSAQIQILYGQLDIFKDCSCGAAEKARGLLGETGLRVSHPLPFPMNPTTKTEILNVRAHSSNMGLDGHHLEPPASKLLDPVINGHGNLLEASPSPLL